MRRTSGGNEFKKKKIFLCEIQVILILKNHFFKNNYKVQAYSSINTRIFNGSMNNVELRHRKNMARKLQDILLF